VPRKTSAGQRARVFSSSSALPFEFFANWLKNSAGQTASKNFYKSVVNVSEGVYLSFPTAAANSNAMKPTVFFQETIITRLSPRTLPVKYRI